MGVSIGFPITFFASFLAFLAVKNFYRKDARPQSKKIGGERTNS